jgi:hypothetical protein
LSSARVPDVSFIPIGTNANDVAHRVRFAEAHARAISSQPQGCPSGLLAGPSSDAPFVPCVASEMSVAYRARQLATTWRAMSCQPHASFKPSGDAISYREVREVDESRAAARNRRLPSKR